VKLWAPGNTLKRVEVVRPLLASWERKTHPAQVRLQAYLEELASAVEPLPRPPARLFLHMDIDAEEPGRLLHHHDLENYLTPVVSHLGADRFQLVSARKRVGGGSQLLVGSVRPVDQLAASEGWEHFACCAGAGTQTKGWKANLRAALAASRPEGLLPGPVEVHLAWRCSPRRNWVWLWKPTLDAMGPVLGEPDPQNPFNPADDRVVYLALHCSVDAMAGHSVDVEMWWRPQRPA